MKRKLLLLLALMAIGLSGAWAYNFSAVAPSGQTLYYNIVGGNAQVTYQNYSSPRYTNLTGALEIPSSVSYNGTTYSVTSIGYAAFYNCYRLTSVTIPNSVTYIGSQAFIGCSNVDTLYYNARNLTTTSEWGNYSSNYNPYGFRPMKLKYLAIGDSVQSLPPYVFYGQDSLTSVTIPNSVTAIGNYTFYGCSNVDTLYYNARNLTTTSEWGIGSPSYYSYGFRPMTLKHLVIGDSVQSLPSYVFYEQDSLTSVTIGNSVTSIGDYAFNQCCSLTSVTIGNSVTSIGTHAFYACSSLTSVTIPNSVTSIVDNAFIYCRGLTSIVVETGNTHYDSRNNCNAIIETGTNTLICGCMNTTIPNSVTTIGYCAFGGCRNIKSFVIPSSVTSMDNNIFANCSNLSTIYDYRSDRSSGSYGLVPSRLVTVNDVDFSGTGVNQIVKIKSTNYTVGTAAADVIPMAELPINHIAYDGISAWKARKIVLTDSRTENNPFTCDVDFTAASVTYNREFDDDRSSTMCLPFAITPEMRDVTDHKFKLYDFYSYNAQTGMATFNVLTDEVSSVANHPYLIQYENNAKGVFQMPAFSNVQFSATTSMNNPTPSNGFHFEGTYTQQTMANTANKEYYGIYYGYFVKSNGEAKVNPFRGYFYTLDAPQGAPAPAGIDYQENEGNVGIELVDPEDNIRYSNDVYDLMGRCVRKNADSLRGLPQGIYIWKGKKMLNY